ncbi:hypothetical protein FHX82_001912 [Amycolatopsis bartoniae]|uniref:Uncharacterized protein n=1 Tax=Amycolatopsis bartoniae TaxID=941986 RepID=A0A8H9M9T2_9PSEU|nr:hypothetical protein [Amycolatopsis bartoniae]MBB2934892.1 hypothetical protein [Amycolatopsis bartoniae]TVS99499.1 hypothetical protein FNH07_34525 [Amycolatopsis bartoniae]GHF44026.1 hypothetical protein GCM10017566_16120 [Amycolatopsis bartoniae]
MTVAGGVLTRGWDVFLAHLEERERRRARRLPGWRTRKHRRALTVLLVVASLVMIVGALCYRRDDIALFAVLWIGGYIAWMVPFALLRILTGRMSSSFNANLDERERDWRHRVSYAGYQVLALLMVVAMLYLIGIARQPDAALRGAFMLCSLLLLGCSVPTVLLGWTLPDDVAEDSVE